jgi:hypothetical protein
MGDDLGGHVPGPAVKISRIRHSAPLRATAQARIMISLPRVECQQRARDAVLCQSPPPAPSQCGRILQTHRGQTMKRGLTAFRRSAEDAWRRERRLLAGRTMTYPLLLDEMFSGAITGQLRAKGHDVLAVVADPALVALPDEQILARAASPGRAFSHGQHQGLRPTGRPLPGSQPGTRRADPRLSQDLPAGPQLHRRHHQRTVCPPRPARTVAAWPGHLPAPAIAAPPPAGLQTTRC